MEWSETKRATLKNKAIESSYVLGSNILPETRPSIKEHYTWNFDQERTNMRF